MKYVECDFVKMRAHNGSKRKIGDHTMPQTTLLKYLGSIIQNDRETERCKS